MVLIKTMPKRWNFCSRISSPYFVAWLKETQLKHSTKDDDESDVIYNIYFPIFEWMISPLFLSYEWIFMNIKMISNPNPLANLCSSCNLNVSHLSSFHNLLPSALRFTSMKKNWKLFIKINKSHDMCRSYPAVPSFPNICHSPRNQTGVREKAARVIRNSFSHLAMET